MRTTLRFFEDRSVSRIGFLRGLVIFPFTTLGAYAMIYMFGGCCIMLKSLLLGLMLCSVLGVQDNGDEDGVTVSMVYGMLAYFAIYFPEAISHDRWYLVIPVSVMFGMINGSILYWLGPRFN